MSHQGAARPHSVGLFLNPMPERRVQFQSDSGSHFSRLFVAADADEAERILAQQQVDLLIIDLDRFDRGIDLAPLGKIVRQRHGAPVMLLCAYACGSWLTDLMRFGPLDYVVAPVGAELVNQRIDNHFDHVESGRDDVAELRGMLALRSDLLLAVAGVDDPAELAGAVCVALARWPGVVHASMFETSERGELTMTAQESPNGLVLREILDPAVPLLDSPLRHGGVLRLTVHSNGSPSQPELLCDLDRLIMRTVCCFKRLTKLGQRWIGSLRNTKRLWNAVVVHRGDERALSAIANQLDSVRAKLEARGVTPGSPTALRLFS